MKKFILCVLIFFKVAISCCQTENKVVNINLNPEKTGKLQTRITTLQKGKTYNQKILKGEVKKYKINLNKGEFCSMIVNQMGVDVVIDVSGPSLKKINSFDTPNGNDGPENITFEADSDGFYYLDIYPLNDYSRMSDSVKNLYIERNQGDYEINSISVLSKEDYAKRQLIMPDFVNSLNLGFEKKSKEGLPANWIFVNDNINFTMDTLVKHSGNASLLLNKKFPSLSGSCFDSIPVVFDGKFIDLRCFIKTQNLSNGYAGVLLKYPDNSELSLIQLHNENIKLYENKDWTQYTIRILLHDAKSISIQFLLTGIGQMWVDDLQLLIDGKDISQVKYREPKKYKADNDIEFDKGSRISLIELKEPTLDNLVTLGKVWGFLKYYHPVIAKGEYNWDYELFRIIPKILSAKNKKERNEVLSDWVKSIGKTYIALREVKIENDVKLRPDLNWIDNSELGEKLTSQLIEIRNTERSNENYYIGQFPTKNPKFKNERIYPAMNFPDAGFRLLSLFRYWNMIQYFFPYKYLIGENWNEVLKEFIPKFLNASNELEYNLTVLSIVSRIHDTHASINNNVLMNYFGIYTAPLEITFIENKAVVTGYYDNILGEESGLKKGDVIETINDNTVDEVVNEKLPITPASNFPTQLRDITFYLLSTNDTTLEISYQRDNSKMVSKIKCYTRDKFYHYDLFNRMDTCFKLITPEIAYLYPGSIKNAYLPEIMNEVQKTKGLIIDLRCYPLENIEETLCDYLFPNPINVFKVSLCSITSPGLFEIEEDGTIGKKNADYYKGKVVIIVNEITQSQAESNAMAFRFAPRATVIGSTTAGADGDVSKISLPGGINTRISGIGVYYADGRETQRVGIIPDIEVKPTIKGITEGRDELLEKAIELIEGN